MTAISSSTPRGRGPCPARKSWRSQRSARDLILNLDAVAELYRARFAPHLDAALNGRMELEIERASSRLRAVEMPLFKAVSDAGQRVYLDDARGALGAMRELVAGPIATALDLAMGFNARDGD